MAGRHRRDPRSRMQDPRSMMQDTRMQDTGCKIQEARSRRQDTGGKIQDTGCGISEEDLPKIFDPFFSTKTEGEGLGLGLSTVRGIIDRHRGIIGVESELGKGTTFVIHLHLGKDHLKSDEIVIDKKTEVSQIESIQESIESEIENVIKQPIEFINKVTDDTKKNLPILLIVEDTEDVRTYIRGFLESRNPA